MDNPLIQDVKLLLRPRTMPVIARGLARSTRGGAVRLLVLGLVGTAFWWGLFAIFWRVLRYFHGIEDIGDLLAYKLLSMILIVSFALLLFSSILTSLSKLYLSRDLILVHAMPVAGHRIFIARWLDSTADSSWMVIVFTMPVFLAYGIVFGAGVVYYINTLLALAVLAAIASALSAMLVMIGVMVVPATRMRSIVILLGVLLFVVLYLAIRLLRPEQLVNPEVFDSVLVYISELQAPAAPFLPSTWAYDCIQAALTGAAQTSAFHLLLAASFAAALVCLLVLTIQVRKQLLPLMRLHRLFQVADQDVPPGEALVLVAEHEGETRTLLVEEILDKQEVVIKSLGPICQRLPGLAGGTILGDGKVGLILDLTGLLAMEAG